MQATAAPPRYPTSEPMVAPPTLLSEAIASLHSTLGCVRYLTDDARGVADRVFGSVPRGVQGANGGNKEPLLSQGEELRGLLRTLEEAVSEARNEVQRLNLL